MDRRALSPYIRLAVDSWAETGCFCIRPRVIFDYEIVMLRSGELDVEVEGVHYHVAPGDVLLFRPKQRHSMRDIGGDPVNQPHVHFDLFEDELSPQVYISFADLPDVRPEEHALFRRDVLDEYCPGLPPYIHPENPRSIERLLMAIIQERSQRMIGSDLVQKGLLLQLLATLEREAILSRKSAPEAQDAAQQVREYLTRNLDRDISLDELAENVHVSKSHLCREFKRIFGISPIQYHLESRINRAKELLTTTDRSIGEIAEAVGFRSIYSFSRAFKQRERVSPSVYRK